MSYSSLSAVSVLNHVVLFPAFGLQVPLHFGRVTTVRISFTLIDGGRYWKLFLAVLAQSLSGGGIAVAAAGRKEQEKE